MSIIITNLEQKPSLLAETISMVESSLGYNNKNHFAVDFSPLIKNNLQNLYIAIQDKKVVGHIGLLPRKLKVGALQFASVAFLGGISVHQDFRGQGIFSSLLNTVFNDWDKRVSLYMLWGNNVDLYQKFNFYLAGGIIQTIPQEISSCEMGKKPLKNWAKTKLKDISKNDFKQIKKIYQQSLASKYSTVVRKDEDWDTIKMITSADLFILRGQNLTKIQVNNEETERPPIIAYFFKDKGADLTNIIYEIGTSPHINPRNIVQEIAEYSVWMPEDWSIYFDQPELHFLAFFRMASHKKFISLVSAWSHGKIKITAIKNNFIYYHFAQEQHRSSFQEFLSLIWGPQPLSELQALGNPLFISGLDSI